jgi:hypothetical protein
MPGLKKPRQTFALPIAWPISSILVSVNSIRAFSDGRASHR